MQVGRSSGRAFLPLLVDGIGHLADMNLDPPIDVWTTSNYETAEARLPAAGLLHMVTVTPDSDSLIARMVLASRFSYE